MPLITYKNRSKIMEQINALDIRNIFEIEKDVNIFLQYFNTEYDSYVDCEFEDPQNVNRKKFLICEIENPPRTPFSTKCQNIIENDARPFSIEEIIASSAKIHRTESTETIILDPTESLILDKADIFELTPSDENCVLKRQPRLVAPSKKRSYENMNSSYEILPTMYKLPFISPDSKLGKALTNKEVLKDKLKREFLTKIYESFSHKGVYYVGHNYDNITNAILNEFPHLGLGLGVEEAKHIWKKSLYSKFYNGKARDDAAEEKVVLLKKAKQERIALGRLQKSHDNTGSYSIPYYNPIKDVEDEDLLSLESHKVWMHTEFNKTHRNDSSIKQRMNMTYNHRRGLLFEVNNEGTLKYQSAAAILDIYPCLRIESHAIEEVYRLFREDLYESQSRVIVPFSIAIEDSVLTSMCKNKAYMKDLFSSNCSESNESCLLFKLLGYLAILLYEDPREVIGPIINETGAPMLIIENNLVSLYIDGEPYIRKINPKNVIFLWLASFSFFHLKVPSKIRRLHDFLQLIIYDIPKHPKLTQGASKLLHTWNTLKNTSNQN